MRTATTSSASSASSRTTTAGSPSRSRRSPTSTPRAASSRASRAATTCARSRAASLPTCASSRACELRPGRVGRRRAQPMIRPFDRAQLDELLSELARPGVVAELAILGGCLVAAWIVVRLIRGRERPVASVWFGNRIVDGLLFPLLALALAYAARIGLAGLVKPAVFKVAIPILISLVVIRLSARVLARTFPGVGWVRVIERSISWLAWICVVLWITGVLPLVLDAMDEVHWQVGKQEMTLRNLVEGSITAAVV